MYLNVNEVESALRALAAAYPNTCQLMELPHKTHEGRTVHALHIGRRNSQKIGGVFLTGGVHAREWGTVDICVNFAADLLESYAEGTGLAYGAVTHSATDIKNIVEWLDVIVLACANPDGRAYDMRGVSGAPGHEDGISWRGNRRPDAKSGCIGVNLNRNQDILWDSDRHLHPRAAARASSSDPCDPENYRGGPSAASEPETRNIVWLLDAFPSIGHYMDIHCYSGAVLYPWGHSPNQSTNPAMNFRNPAFDGQRGQKGGPYGEHIEPAHERMLRSTADRVVQSINHVRGLIDRDLKYHSGQSFFFEPGDPEIRGWYPTTGTNDDFAYSRHFFDPRKKAILAFTMEFNRNVDFYPPWSEMVSHHIPDTCAGLLALCLDAFTTSFPRVDLPEIFGQIFGGVIAGGGGIVILPSGKVIKIPPRQERILQALEAMTAYLAAQEVGQELGRELSLTSLRAVEQIIIAEIEQLG